MFELLSILLVVHSFHLIHSECPPTTIIRPCSCVVSIPSLSYALFDSVNNDIVDTEQKSIVCEHIQNSTFDLRSIFARLTSYTDLIVNEDENATRFDSFLLSNTTVTHIPNSVFANITFKSLMFQNNPLLTTIELNAFSPFDEQVEAFETMNTNLSDTTTIFAIIKQFRSLRHLSMHNDRLQFIPANAFNHSNLSEIWFGLEFPPRSQPIETIGDYAFYNLPNIRFIRIFSPKLTRISKYAFAQRTRSTMSNDIKHMLELYLGGEMLNSTSFELTSLNRFRTRPVFLRLYNTKISYLDENVFQPFLESNPSSLIDLNQSNDDYQCDCRSAWIQYDYFRHIDQLDNRVYGYGCWAYDFPANCTMNRSI